MAAMNTQLDLLATATPVDCAVCDRPCEHLTGTLWRCNQCGRGWTEHTPMRKVR